MSTIRSLCIGISAHQKLEHLSSLVTLLGYESLAVFGDCFDEVCSIVFILKMSSRVYRLSGACLLSSTNTAEGKGDGDVSILVAAALGPIFWAPSIKASLEAVVRAEVFGRFMAGVYVLQKTSQRLNARSR